MQRKIWAFAIKADGTLADKRLLKKFADHGFDGMRCDVRRQSLRHPLRQRDGGRSSRRRARVLREIDVLGEQAQQHLLRRSRRPHGLRDGGGAPAAGRSFASIGRGWRGSGGKSDESLLSATVRGQFRPFGDHSSLPEERRRRMISSAFAS